MAKYINLERIFSFFLTSISLILLYGFGLYPGFGLSHIFGDSSVNANK